MIIDSENTKNNVILSLDPLSKLSKYLEKVVDFKKKSVLDLAHA